MIIPRDFREQNILRNRTNILNYGLKIDKFGFFNENKLDYINDNDRLYHNFSFTNYEDIIKYAREKQENLKKNLEKQGYYVASLTLKQNWRLVLNLGQESGYNNGFLLHPVFGIPYLSESAIKGMARTYYIEKHYNFKEKDAILDPTFQELFGAENENNPTTGKQGCIRFSPAFPTNTIENPFNIVADIMNNHNTSYYDSNNQYPTDTESPIPIKFITLKDASFEPFIYVKKGKQKLLENMLTILKEAFELKGIGAKTNKGYGRLVFDEEAEIRKETERKKAERKANEEAERKAQEEAELKEKLKAAIELSKKLAEDGIIVLLEKCSNFNDFKEVIKSYKKESNFSEKDIENIKNKVENLVKKPPKFRDKNRAKYYTFLNENDIKIN